MQILGVVGTGANAAYAFNSSGSAAGFYTDAYGNMNAAVWNAGNTTQLSSNGIAMGINDAGVAVGAVYSGSTPTATVWSGGTATSLGVTGYATTINHNGEIGGSYQFAPGISHAFTYSAGAFSDLGTLGGNWSSLSALSALGTGAGTSTLANGVSRAFLYANGGMTQLGTLGGANSYGSAISTNGQYVAGSSQNYQNYLNAFLWSASGMQNLGTLGGSVSWATGVNDSGWVVGDAATSGNASIDAFLYENGSMIDLNSLLPAGSGWDITNADAIDDTGDILATAEYGSQNYVVELSQAHLFSVRSAALSAIATPEPSALLLTGLGVFGIGLVGRKRAYKVVRNR